ncbi:MAG: site-specific integrase, partial [Melioribacteraceae bacterium]|nr:site-specific integrase [Melioribacteraceae bacterium]
SVDIISSLVRVIYYFFYVHFLGLTSVPDKAISTYTREDYYYFIDEMERAKLSQNTQAIYTSRVYAIFNWLSKENVIQKNHMKTVAEEVKDLEIISDENMRKFFEYAKGKKHYYLVKFLVLSAFRIEEALNLKKSDVNSIQINVLGKGNKKAAVPLTEDLKEFFKECPVSKEREIYFNTTYGNFKAFLRRAEEATGVKIKSHDFRKYCLSNMANAGVNIFLVKNFARHSNIKTTLKYYAGVDHQKAADEINSRISFKVQLKF